MSEIVIGYFSRNDLITDLRAEQKRIASVPINLESDQAKSLGERFGQRDATAHLLQQVTNALPIKAERIDEEYVYDFAGYISSAQVSSAIQKLMKRHQDTQPPAFKDSYEQGRFEGYAQQLHNLQQEFQQRPRVSKEDLRVRRQRKPGFYI